MIPPTSLTQIGKMVAKNLAHGHTGELVSQIGHSLASAQGITIDLIDLIAAESCKKRPNVALINAFVAIIGNVLETLRFRIERNHVEAEQAVAVGREHLTVLIKAQALDPTTALLISGQFTRAKLDLGDDLPNELTDLLNQEASPFLPSEAELNDRLAELARPFKGDIFEFQAHLAEQTASLPDDGRGGGVAALLGATDPMLRESAIGWLLDTGPKTRRDTVSLLMQSASNRRISEIMLRRLITIRNWLPEPERPGIDAVIRSCRQNGLDCGPAREAETRICLASGIDGSGAQSFFVMVKEGRKQAIASLLIKHGVGVRDAWVRRRITKLESEQFLFQVESQIECFNTTTEYVRRALSNALAVSAATGTLPPFGLVDFIESTGLGTVNPGLVPFKTLLAELLSDIPAARKTPAKIERVLRETAQWEGDFSFFDSWFEDEGALDVLLSKKRLSVRRQVDVVLTEFLPSRREHWGELLVWTALMLRQDKANGNDWEEFVLVANELIGDRPVSEIPLMNLIAKTTVEAWRSF